MNHSHTKPGRPVEKRLELQKPVFFSGQYLSELDLQSIVTWTEQRLRFAQHGQPWGIAEGLYVSVLSQSTEKTQGEDRLSISPGWALNAQHELCISDKPIERDLPKDESPECRVEIRASAVGPWIDAQSLGDVKITQVIDLYVEPLEAETGHILGASVTGKKNCHASRNKASLRISSQSVNLHALDQQPGGSDPDAKPEMKFLSSYIESFHNTPPLGALKDWLARQEQVYPHALRLWPTVIKTVPETDDPSDRIAKLLEWCCFSLRVTRQPNYAVQPRIPLARLWLVRDAGLRRVFWIDERARYRKLLNHSLPQFVCADWIGASYSTASAAASRIGVNLSPIENWHPSINDLQATFGPEPERASALENNSLQALVKPLVSGGENVIVAFTRNVGA